jgi:hypothetical protein
MCRDQTDTVPSGSAAAAGTGLTEEPAGRSTGRRPCRRCATCAPPREPTARPPARAWALSTARTGQELLAARYDVSARSPGELLRLDYKQAAAAGGRAVGVAAVCLPGPELMARAGGAAGLEETMRAAARSRGVDVLLALSAEDPADPARSKALFAGARSRPAESAGCERARPGALRRARRQWQGSGT